METISRIRGMSLLEYVARLFLWVDKIIFKTMFAVLDFVM